MALIFTLIVNAVTIGDGSAMVHPEIVFDREINEIGPKRIGQQRQSPKRKADGSRPSSSGRNIQA
ncbi:hypothetical protein RP75_27725 [Agrobacterium arsenijevicii]|uniref:Uncharacterized protein n=1 Tax=Agrobacterium arsenijevicii TaxID=1585697 RepID=A0ABR5CZK9_9HYPH|nr:hypothetical protein RP75_27725 [Agrobacterium arsenijevicii]